MGDYFANGFPDPANYTGDYFGFVNWGRDAGLYGMWVGGATKNAKGEITSYLKNPIAWATGFGVNTVFGALPTTKGELATTLAMLAAGKVGGLAGGGSLAGGAARGAGHVFWAGEGAEEAATAFARKFGGQTIGMTEGGRELAAATKGMDWFSEARPLWEQASKKFASDATGTVHVFHSAEGVKLNSIWVQEHSILQQNGVNIIYHTVGGY